MIELIIVLLIGIPLGFGIVCGGTWLMILLINRDNK